MTSETVTCRRCMFTHRSDEIAENNKKFNNFLKAQGIEANNPIVPKLKKFWNKAIDLSFEIVTSHEGTCFGINALKVK